MTTEDRITDLESQVRTLKRLLLACGSVALLAIFIAGIAVSPHIVGAVSKDTPMRIEIVGFGKGTLPVRVDRTVRVDGSVEVDGSVGVDGSVDVDASVYVNGSVDVNGSVNAAIGNAYGPLKVNNIGN